LSPDKYNGDPKNESGLLTNELLEALAGVLGENESVSRKRANASSNRCGMLILMVADLFVVLMSTWRCFSEIDSLGLLQRTIDFLDITGLFSCWDRTAF
jgi:hypothetical protein